MILVNCIALALTGCANLESNTSEWSDASKWYDTNREVDNNLADVFYIVSTEILEEKDSTGHDTYIGKLTPEERKAYEAEMKYVQNMFGDSLNLFSPYYKQFTMSSINLPAEEMERVRKEAADDVVSAFRYYIQHLNNGRPFILAGFSQGAMHMIDILQDMSQEDYERMIVAYCMGYRLSESDLKHPHIKAAQSADDLGVTVSFNSVATPDAIWPMVNADAATCINPVNYRTDNEPAEFVFDNDTLTVRVDTMHNVLIVESANIESYRFPILDKYCKPGNLHHWDLLFYGESIRRNALDRAR